MPTIFSDFCHCSAIFQLSFKRSGTRIKHLLDPGLSISLTFVDIPNPCLCYAYVYIVVHLWPTDFYQFMPTILSHLCPCSGIFQLIFKQFGTSIKRLWENGLSLFLTFNFCRLLKPYIRYASLIRHQASCCPNIKHSSCGLLFSIEFYSCHICSFFADFRLNFQGYGASIKHLRDPGLLVLYYPTL